MSLFFAAVCAAALALPPPVLGPDGFVWAGPVAPGSEDSARWAAVLGVDIRAGQPLVEVATADGLLAWSAGGWLLGGAPLRVAPSARWDVDATGELVAVRSRSGARLRFLYGASGALAGVLLPGGGHARFVWDAEGRVTGLLGPGPSGWSLARNDAIAVRGPDGETLTVRFREGTGAVEEEVVDALGRRAVVEWEAGAVLRPRSVTDPAGVRTEVGWEGDRVRIAQAGAAWVLGLDGASRVQSLVLPSGRTWRWEHGPAGHLLALVSPTGQRFAWERRPDGVHVATAGPAGTWVWERDPEGRLSGWVTPAGGRVVLHRDRAGRLVGGTDAVGNRIVLARDGRGRITGLVERDGARWALETDDAGRLHALTDPRGRSLRLRRDDAGRLVSVHDGGNALLGLRRGPSGRLLAVTTADGASTLFVRDPLGRVARAVRADGRSFRLERDPRGDVVAVLGEGTFRLERDAHGRPVRAGDARFGWSADGALTSLERGGVRFTVAHDAAGRAATVRAGEAVLSLTRDAAGRIARWELGASVLRVARDAVGLIVREEGEGVVELRRDAAGRVSAVRGPAGTWEVSTDAAGRPLRVDGPGGLDLGVDRDGAGLPVLVRVPGGALFSRRLEPRRAVASWMDRNGRAVWGETDEFGPTGELRARTGLDGERHRIRRDPLGDVIAEESSAGLRWSRTPASRSAAGGWVLRDEAGRWVEALVPPGADAWGLGDGVLTAERAPDGALRAVHGPSGSVRVERDAFGRLRGLRGPAVAARVRYDARGRPSGVQGGAGDGVLRWADLGFGVNALEIGGGVPVLSGPFGPQAVGAGESWAVWLRSPDGRVQATQVGREDPVRAPASLPAALGAALGEGVAAVFPGGPTVGPGLPARDPLGGERLERGGDWAWALDPTAGVDPWADPAPWASRSVFGDPVGLIVHLGGVGVPAGPAGLGGAASEAPLEGFPVALGGADAPPLGPDPASLPVEADLWEALVLRALMPGARAIGVDDPLAAALQAELSKECELPVFPVVGLGRLGPSLADGPPWGLANPPPSR